tara:strand:+ start:4017 stop:4595 length:579 start_codon:yes stop_codon:yes gene_type:complete
MITWTERNNIIDEIKEWSKHTLEVSNPEFNNLPVCPYAKAAWKQAKVDIVFKFEKEDYKRLYMALHNWSDRKDLVIIADTEYIEDQEEFHEFVDNINEAIANNVFRDKDMWVMGFHPEDEPNELFDEEEDVEPISEIDYAIFFVQRLSKLEEAAEKLRPLGYYDKYFQEYDVKHMYELRTNFYRRLRHEESC